MSFSAVSSPSESENKDSFPSLMNRLYESENSINELSDSELDELAKKLTGKVDSYHEVMEVMKSDVAMLKAREDAIAKKRRAIENNLEGLRKLMLFHLGQNELSKWPGKHWVANRIVKSNSAIKEIKKTTPTPFEATKFKEYVKTARTWKKKEILADLKTSKLPEELQAYFGLRDVEDLKWTVRVQLEGES